MATTTPRGYKVAMASCQLCKSLDDASPFVIFDASLASAREVSLNNTAVSIGENTAYPAAGTYRYMLVKMLYVQQDITIKDFPNPGNNNVTDRIYFSSLAPHSKADIMLSTDSGANWKWIDTTAAWAFSDAKPLSFLKQNGGLDVAGGLQLNQWNGVGARQIFVTAEEPFTFLIPLTAPMTVPADPTGKWVVTMSFDTSENTAFDDNNANGILDNGESFWCEVPGITTSFVRQ